VEPIRQNTECSVYLYFLGLFFVRGAFLYLSKLNLNKNIILLISFLHFFAPFSMKKNILFLFSWSIMSLSFAQHDHASAPTDTTQKPKKKPLSPRLSAMAMVGDNHVHIDYGSPSVRGRQIWNGLVAYQQVWSTGAHKATWVDFGQEVIIAGKRIAKGRYGLFTIPGQTEWTVILSKDWDMHLADDYVPEHDALRLTVKPQKNNQLVEALHFEVSEHKGDKGTIKMSWEWVSVSFDFENQ
jgi:Protein of unknown function (DUF2911)